MLLNEITRELGYGSIFNKYMLSNEQTAVYLEYQKRYGKHPDKKDYTLNNKYCYVQILDEKKNLAFRKVLTKKGIAWGGCTAMGIHFDKKNYKKVKKLLLDNF